MNNNIKKRLAFSMIELVFVIAVLGIVSSLGAEIIVKIYESYITQRASYRSSIKTELAATQIANRLAYAIPNTVIGRRSASDSNYSTITNLPGTNYEVLQWIAYDDDSFNAFGTPAWSGLADLDACSISKISTPGSNLGFINNVISNLSDTGTKIANAIILFPSEYYTGNNIDDIGYNGDISGLHTIISASGTDININPISAGTTIKERYKLAWSSYAIVPQQNAKGLFDLYLKYDFQPWEGERYNGAIPSSLLIRNVSVFRFTGTSSAIRFKLCQQEEISNGSKITTCKEKVVIR